MNKCKEKLNKFCYCCGHLIKAEGRLNDEFKTLYTAYFDQPFVADEWYAPNSVCHTCCSSLADWKRSDGRDQMKFGVPMLWSMPKANEHDPSDCYVCANGKNRIKKSKVQNFAYKSVDSAKIPVAHSVAKVPYKYPGSPETSDIGSNDEDEDEDESESDSDDDKTPQRLNQTGECRLRRMKFWNKTNLICIDFRLIHNAITCFFFSPQN